MRKKELEREVASLSKQISMFQSQFIDRIEGTYKSIQSSEERIAYALIEAGLLVPSERVKENAIYFQGERYVIKKAGK